MDPDSPRARRAARAGSTRKGIDMSQVPWGKIIGVTLVVGVFALFIAYPFFAGGGNEDCPNNHCHSALHIWVQPDVSDDASWERISFASNKYTYQGDQLGGIFPLRHHMHAQEARDQIHWEPITKARLEMSDFLELADVHITRSEFRTDAGHEEVGQGFGIVANETVEIKVYEAFGFQDDWKEISVNKFLDWEPVDGTKHLVVVGDPTAEKLAELQAGVPAPSAWASGVPPDQHPQ